MMLWTENPRLAALYDTECAGREDHDFYLALAERLQARSVVDIGCGTGVFAVDVASAADGTRRNVIGVDPALPMLDIAGARPGGDLVEWIQGTAPDVGSEVADLVIMMGHVAQYFVSDDAWTETLQESRRILRPGGTLAFEVRNPDRGWPDRWTKDKTFGTLSHPDGGEFQAWVQSVHVDGPPHSFTETHEGHSILPNGDHLVSQETLRFRSPAQIETSLNSAGFKITNSWGDWNGDPFTPTSDELIIAANPR